MPVSQTVSLGEMAEFRCRHDSANAILWKVNGSLINNPQSDITIESISGSGGSKLTIVGQPKFDGVDVVCVAFFFDSAPNETNPPAILRGMFEQYRHVRFLLSRIILIIILMLQFQ